MTNNRMVSWEAHLIARSKDGDRTAFELLCDLYRPGLLQMAQRMMRNGDDAQDAVQECLLKAFRAISDFDSARPIKPWLYRICANCCVDAVRGRRRDTDSLDQHEYMLTDGDSVHGEIVAHLEGEEVRDAVLRLPRKYRRIIQMRHYEHKDVMEIARELDTPEGTVKSWLFRARTMLRKELSLAS